MAFTQYNYGSGKIFWSCRSVTLIHTTIIGRILRPFNKGRIPDQVYCYYYYYFIIPPAPRCSYNSLQSSEKAFHKIVENVSLGLLVPFSHKITKCWAMISNKKAQIWCSSQRCSGALCRSLKLFHTSLGKMCLRTSVCGLG